MQINRLSTSPIHEQIVLDIKKQIKDGILTPGDRLLSTRELATTLKINPNTVNRAYKELEKKDFIVILPGKGIFIKNKKDEATSAMKEKDLKLELELLLLDTYYQNISQETISDWVDSFYSKVVTKK